MLSTTKKIILFGKRRPIVTYIGGAQPTYSGNVATATNINIGTAYGDRLVVLVFFDMNNGANSTASVTINGNAATVDTVANSTFNPVQGIASLNVPAGTTATIAVTYGAAGGFGRFEIYTITGLSSFAHVGANSNWNGGLNPISTTIATLAGGVIITGAAQNITPSGTTTSFSGTETYAMDQTDIDLRWVPVRPVLGERRAQLPTHQARLLRRGTLAAIIQLSRRLRGDDFSDKPQTRSPRTRSAASPMLMVRGLVRPVPKRRHQS
jgi:hypothetical protein